MRDLPHHELRRTARQMNLPGFGLEQQTALHNAHVFVIGAGGLGCPLMQTLAATGIGRITVIDDDTVDVSNIHRQILFGADDVGRAKVDVAGERLRALQPGIELNCINGRFSDNNALGLLAGVDVLVDGSDTFATKFLAADAAEIAGVPLVWGSVLRYRGDVALWFSGPGAPADGAGLRDLYPTQPGADSVPDCATAGVLGVTTSVVGGLMATEVIKYVTGVGDSVVGRLRMYDALSAAIRTFDVARDPGRDLVTGFGVYGGGRCEVVGASTRELLGRMARGEVLGLDVREEHEKALSDIPGATHHLPTSEWEADDDAAARSLLDALPRDAEVVVYCASGSRSQRFVERFADVAQRRGITLTSLPGGANMHGIE
ncbi:ThiF family adenylyltransferase [Corynebacterium sanguinis]|uniref:ThiF family adenylyltransferase n=1 Tax=Corynebacterium sanguinis TaxID=2594913 RepID=UPI001186B0BC|nr:ThiF family adenylyltransferase [Corynebacterium sanguinis]MCT1444893.1 ThiF family adenylyltransferase [Corynebacterium sanguinis]MCT1597650.1 ThiF family adenylyltransferase [Corynebacterium sanguinis]MCT1629379.1 ThiF family adenylyltransferase [Corynebacterium sanguinis]QDR76832.1 ThiF family adenylyltransferase [Corynebacterium sanguinis]